MIKIIMIDENNFTILNKNKDMFEGEKITNVYRDYKFDNYFIATSDKKNSYLISKNGFVLGKIKSKKNLVDVSTFLSKIISTENCVEELNKIKDLSFLVDKNIQKEIFNLHGSFYHYKAKQAQVLEANDIVEQLEKSFELERKTLKAFFARKTTIYKNREKVKTIGLNEKVK